MECLKCGSKLKGETCLNCGEKYHYIKTKTLKETSNFKINIIIIVLVISFIGLVSMGFKYLENYSLKEYVEINNLKIPTITSIIGYKNVIKFDTNSKKEIVQYSYQNFNDDEIKKYISELNKQDFLMYEKKDGIGLVKDSDGLITQVNLLIENGILKIEYISSNDIISNYKLIGERQIGNESVGYLRIPAKFSKTGKSDVLEYVNNNETITISNIENIELIPYTQELLDLYEKNNAITNTFTLKIEGCKGYQISATFKEGIFLRSYIFVKDNEIINITIETNNPASDINSVIYSYLVVK